MIETETVDIRSGKNTFADLAYDYIVERIVTHKLLPGERLRAKDLAKVLGISPTPIERALERLAGEGLVEFKPGLGPQVCTATVDEILELYDARLMCDLYAVEHGIENVDAAFLDRLFEAMTSLDAARANPGGSMDGRRIIADLDSAFHMLLVSLWPNRKVQAWYRQLHVHIKSYQLAHVPGYHREAAMTEHREIYEAMCQKDLGKVTDVLRVHTELSKQSFLRRVEMAGLR